MSFKDYKNKRQADLEEVRKQLADASDKVSYEKDPDDWYPSVDKTGNGLAVVRLLPALETEPNTRWVRWFSHSFKNPSNNRWYIENSLTTFGFKDNPDPMAEYNNKLWNSTEDKNHPNRKQAQKQSRKFNARVNVLVISDSANPTNNGQIKKWLMGKLFYKEIDSLINPAVIEGAIEQDEPVNPFDLFEGKNLKIKIGVKQVDGKDTRDYKLSWSDKGPVFKDEVRIEQLYDKLNSEPDRWSLLKYIAPDKFKTYDVLKEKMVWVFGGNDPLNEGEAIKASEPKEYVKTPLTETAPKELPSEEPKEKFDFNSLKDEGDEGDPWN